MTVKIPFNVPVQVGAELDYIRDAIARRKLSGDGHYTAECQIAISRMTGGGASLLTHSCTASLEMAMLMIDLKPGDEVILPSYTFVSTANAVALRGATPVFVDIRPDTLNIDETLIEAAVTERTRAIIAVHYAGVVAEMDAINAIAARHGLTVVEDAAQALGSTYRGRPAGSLSSLAAFSFHETKNVISGEGGALVINELGMLDRAEIIREKGTNRRQFHRGQVDKYTWINIGSSYLPGELIAAYLLAQLEKVDLIQRDRLATWHFYAGKLAGLTELGYRLPQCPDYCGHNGHLFYLIAPDSGTRDALMEQLRLDGTTAPFHYVPLHSAPKGREMSRTSGAMTVTDDLSTRLLRLPLYFGAAETRSCVVDQVWTRARALAR